MADWTKHLRFAFCVGVRGVFKKKHVRFPGMHCAKTRLFAHGSLDWVLQSSVSSPFPFLACKSALVSLDLLCLCFFFCFRARVGRRGDGGGG